MKGLRLASVGSARPCQQNIMRRLEQLEENLLLATGEPLELIIKGVDTERKVVSSFRLTVPAVPRKDEERVAVKAIARRLRRLESLNDVLESPRRMRLVICAIGRPMDLQNSTCRRRLDRTGLLTEIVELMGSRSELTDEQLEGFIAGFPVEQT